MSDLAWRVPKPSQQANLELLGIISVNLIIDWKWMSWVSGGDIHIQESSLHVHILTLLAAAGRGKFALCRSAVRKVDQSELSSKR